MTAMKCTLYATVRRLLDKAGQPVDEPAPQPPRCVRFALDRRPYPKGYFCKYERKDAGEHKAEDAGKEIGLDLFLDGLQTAWNSQVLLYVHGTGAPATVLKENERLQEQCDDAEPGLVQVVPVLWPSPDRRTWTGGNAPEADAQPAQDAPDGTVGVGVGDVLRTLLHWRDNQPLASRKRISVLAHGTGARVLRDALASWADDTGPPYGAFRNIFLVAADVGQHALETGRPGQRLSDAARNVTVYYANDDWAFSSPASRRRDAATRRLGQTGPADLSAAAQNVYAVDCDDVYALDRDDGRGGVAAESAESPYFFAGSGGGERPYPPASGDRDHRETRDEDHETPGPMVTHLLHALRTGRVDADPATRTWVLATEPAGDELER